MAEPKKKVAVIGAGPAGMTAAYELSKYGLHVEVFEGAPAVGGMSRTIDLWDQKVDLGSHRFFSSDLKVNTLWLEVVGSRYRMINRLSRIYYKRTFFHYPLRAFNALFGLGLFEAVRCVASYGLLRLNPHKDESNFDKWVENRFGHRLFSIFFKSYSEKLWGLPCSQIDADFAKQRIKKFSLSEAIKRAFFKPKTSKHQTLVDQFAYPYEGTGMVYEEMAKRVTQQGNKISLGVRVKSVLEKAGKAYGIELENGETKLFDHIVSTMPITNLVTGLNAPESVRQAAGQLTFRNTILVYLEIEGPNPFPDQWIYVHSPELRTGRISNFRNWVPELVGNAQTTILCLEYWCYDSDSIWHESEEAVVAMATAEIEKTALIKRGVVKRGKMIRVPKCYPVYKSGYRDLLKPVEAYLRTVGNLTPIGRYGAFKYNNQDHSILMGMLAAENIAKGTTHDLWSINTDYNYQEAAIISETGLVKIV
jgi:protoporphyrinogen oxidase